jgi:hypothetical protein
MQHAALLIKFPPTTHTLERELPHISQGSFGNPAFEMGDQLAPS